MGKKKACSHPPTSPTPIPLPGEKTHDVSSWRSAARSIDAVNVACNVDVQFPTLAIFSSFHFCNTGVKKHMSVPFAASEKSAGDHATRTFGYAFFSKRSVRDEQKERQKEYHREHYLMSTASG